MKCCNHQCGEGRDCPMRQAWMDTPSDVSLFAKLLAMVAAAFVLVLFLPPLLMGWRP